MADDNTNKAGIRAYYQPTGKEEEMLKRVYRRKIQMEDGSDYKKASANWDKWRKMWESERQAADSEWQSNHIVPLTPSVVETALGEMVDQTPQPFILARGSEDVPRATVMRHVFTYSWEVSNSDAALYDVMKDTLITGTGLAQEYYLRCPRKIRYYVKVGEKLEEKEETVADYDDVVLEPIKLEDFRVDESARGFFGSYAARDCMRRYIMDVNDFKNYFQQPGWAGLAKNLEFVKPGGDLDYYEFYRPPQGIDRKNQVEAWWYWSKQPDDWLVVVANDVIAYMGPNIYKHKQLPFARSADIKRPHSFYHKGEPEVLESIQDEKNIIRRMMIDRNHLDLDKMFAVSNRLQLTEDDLIARPHGLIPVDDLNQIKAIEYGDTPRSVEISLTKLDEDGIIATGIDPRLSAMPTAGTATEAAIVKEAALKRIRMKLRILEREFLVQVARLRVANILQFYSQPKLEAVLGDTSSAKYQAEIQKLVGRGMITSQGGQMMKKTYRNIRIKDRELYFDTKGTVQEKPIKGYSFFEADPQYFTPTAKDGFDIKFLAGSTLPVSKPLMQTKAAEMYDRLVQLAVNGVGYDPVKLGDLLLTVNDYEPDDYHLDQQADQTESDQRMQQLVDLAMQENQMMAQGQEVPATPNASPAHTRMHIEYLKSDQVPKDQGVIQIFSDHITPEIMAETQRGTMGQTAGMNQGGGVVPTPQGAMTANQSGEGLRGAVSGGRNKKPTMAMNDVMPGRVTGGNNLPVQI